MADLGAVFDFTCWTVPFHRRGLECGCPIALRLCLYLSSYLALAVRTRDHTLL